MKLAPRDAGRFLDRPEPRVPAILIFGADPVRVADARARVARAHAGPGAEADMRLDRIDGAALRKDPAVVGHALKARGFFPGPRAVVVDDATDTASPALEGALADWAPGDALLIVTGGELKAQSRLRKLFEAHKTALALAIYDDPPSPADVDGWLRAAGLARMTPEAARDLAALGQALPPGEFRQMLASLVIFKLNDPGPLTADEVADLAPPAPEAEVDGLVAAVALGERARVAPLVARLAGQGVTPVAMAIALARHLRLLHRLTGDPAGAARAAERARPPLNFRVKEQVLRQARLWRPDRLDEALAEAVALDLALRSGAPVPARALAERAMIRIAGLAARPGG